MMMHNENFENTFNTPEDDFDAISLSDNEQIDLLLYPVTALTDTTSSSPRVSRYTSTEQENGETEVSTNESDHDEIMKISKIFLIHQKMILAQLALAITNRPI